MEVLFWGINVLVDVREDKHGSEALCSTLIDVEDSEARLSSTLLL